MMLWYTKDKCHALISDYFTMTSSSKVIYGVVLTFVKLYYIQCKHILYRLVLKK